MSKFFYRPTVGIDVSADFSVVAILAPNGEIYRKPFKIKHNRDGFDYLVDQIKKAEEEFNMETGIFMESTGVYHLTLFHFLKDKFQTYIFNPLITNSNKNSGIRKVKNDKSNEIHSVMKSNRLPETFKKNVQLVYSIPGVGELTAITIMSEIGNIEGFVKPKHLVAYFGLDPSVNQSGKFKMLCLNVVPE